jgi:hypothetical protein
MRGHIGLGVYEQGELRVVNVSNMRTKGGKVGQPTLTLFSVGWGEYDEILSLDYVNYNDYLLLCKGNVPVVIPFHNK